eukprot:PhF_6_TR5580/c0_g1_i2/m.7994/K10863/APTX; aprataxin
MLFQATLVPLAVCAATASRLLSPLPLLSSGPEGNSITILGREHLDPPPSTCSREQLQFQFNHLTGNVFVTKCGLNPCWVLPKEDPTTLRAIPEAPEQLELHSGDILTTSADSGLCQLNITQSSTAPPPTPPQQQQPPPWSFPFPPYKAPPPPPQGGTGEGLQGLTNAIKSINAGEKHPLTYYVGERLVVLYDLYPKSVVHLLVLPRDPRITDLSVLGTQHLPLVQEMIQLGDAIMAHLGHTDPRRKLITGFHGIPSLRPLHMHVMSLDLSTPYMKKKKHYNSFATHFFLGAPGVLRDLESNGRVTLIDDKKRLEALENGPMTCVWCGKPLASFPEVKPHIASCPNNMAMTKS